MLLANMAVAHKTHRTFPERALLRRHPPPQTKMLNDLVEFCEQLGLPMDFSSAGALNVSAGSAREGKALGRGLQVTDALAMGHTPHQDQAEGSRSTLRGGQGSCGRGWAGLGWAWAQKLSIGG